MRAGNGTPVNTKVYFTMSDSLKLEAIPGPARVGIGGPVGSGKTALIEKLIPAFHKRNIELGIITNDLVTKEDAERIRKSGLIAPERVMAVEAGACPHTVIREDPTLNIETSEQMALKFPQLELILIESGGDNLASTFSLDLVDQWMFVIDVAGGDDIPRKKGPGILLCDLLVINKKDLAPYVGVDFDAMYEEAKSVRENRPVAAINSRTGEGIDEIVDFIANNLLFDSTTS